MADPMKKLKESVEKADREMKARKEQAEMIEKLKHKFTQDMIKLVGPDVGVQIIVDSEAKEFIAYATNIKSEIKARRIFNYGVATHFDNVKKG